MRNIAHALCHILFAMSVVNVAVAQPSCDLGVTQSNAARSDQWQGFWLGQSIGAWTGMITEMDKIGGEGEHGRFYTRVDWGKPDQPREIRSTYFIYLYDTTLYSEVQPVR